MLSYCHKANEPRELFWTPNLQKNIPESWPMHSVKSLYEIYETLIQVKLLFPTLLPNLSSIEDHFDCSSIQPKATLWFRQCLVQHCSSAIENTLSTDNSGDISRKLSHIFGSLLIKWNKYVVIPQLGSCTFSHTLWNIVYITSLLQ